MKIGLCGTGRMGSAIVQRLLASGHEVTVWNRNPAKAAPLVALGAKGAETPKTLANSVDLVITMLLDDTALEAVYSGAEGILSADLKTRAVMDMSTVLPSTEEKIGALVKATGAAFVECPVGGTVGPARDGKLLGLVGGTEADVARIRGVLDQLCRRVEHVGAVGAGARLKLAINLPLLVYWQSLGEALALCQPLGLPPARLIDILADTTGANGGIKLRGADIAKALSGEVLGAPAFDVRAARKDLATMVAYGKTLGVELPATEGALSSFNEAAEAGLLDQDAISVPARWAKRKGT